MNFSQIAIHDKNTNKSILNTAIPISTIPLIKRKEIVKIELNINIFFFSKGIFFINVKNRHKYVYIIIKINIKIAETIQPLAKL